LQTRRSPPVLFSGSGWTILGMRDSCARIINGGEKHTDARVDSTIGYSPCIRLIPDSFSHSCDVRTPLCATFPAHQGGQE